MVIMTPADENETRIMLSTAYNHKGPASVRYPRGFTEGLDLDLSDKKLEIGKSKTITKGEKIAYLVFGTLLNTVSPVFKTCELYH